MLINLNILKMNSFSNQKYLYVEVQWGKVWNIVENTEAQMPKVAIR